MAQGGDELAELVQQLFEYPQVAFKAMDYPFDHPLHLGQQAALVAVAAVEHARLSHGVEQAAGRMVVLREQCLVLQRHLQVGRVQV